jgi:multidrug efflux pump subunit AcrB
MVTKRADASSLSVVNALKANLPRMRAALPDDIDVAFEFDQSPYVTRAIWGVGGEGLLGAGLTGLMVFLFLRDWRSVLVVVLNIPLALLGAVVALWLSGETLNLMTLAGLALAVGILVDESTVEVENIHAQMARAESVARAVRRGNAETAVPRLLAMLCILAVFLPSFFMEGAARALFVPLALAVGFAMVTSYVLSSTLVPVLAVWLLRRRPGPSPHPGRSAFARLRAGYGRALEAILRRRRVVVPAFLGVAALAVWQAGGRLGSEIFPTVDAGQFQLQLRAPAGTRLQKTELIAVKTIQAVEDMVGPDNVDISLGYAGTIPSGNPINNIYQWMSGPEEAVLRFALRPGSGLAVGPLKERLRAELPRRLAEKGEYGVRFAFEPADMVNQVMSFGSPTPVEVAVSGPDLAANWAYAEEVRRRLAEEPTLRDVQFGQAISYPTVDVHVNRELAGMLGVSMEDVSRSLVAATSSSRFVAPNFWRDPQTGIGYQVQVEIPASLMNSPHRVEMLPIKNVFNNKLPLTNMATVKKSAAAARYDRYNMRRMVSVTTDVEGEDLGRAARRVARALTELGPPPRGMEVEVRGQARPMREVFGGLGLGLGLAVVVIFLLLAAYFQSLRLALLVLSTAPAVMAGVALALLATGTTLNIQSFMGAIMAVGVAVANAILLVTFAERERRAGAEGAAAAAAGARHRLRPILMTSCAMIAGMVPMAVGFGEGGEQTAPLARAVIGGLAAATLMTLLVLPAVFAMVQGRAGRRSVSLDADDPESPHFDRGGGNAALAATQPAGGGVWLLSAWFSGRERPVP